MQTFFRVYELEEGLKKSGPAVSSGTIVGNPWMEIRIGKNGEIFFCNPEHNLTGVCFTLEEMERLLKEAKHIKETLPSSQAASGRQGS